MAVSETIFKFTVCTCHLLPTWMLGGILGMEQTRKELAFSPTKPLKHQESGPVNKPCSQAVISALPSCLHWMLEATACSCCTHNRGSGCQRKMQQSRHTFLTHQSCQWTSTWNEQPAAYNPTLGSRSAALANSMLLQIETDGNAFPCQSCYSPRAKKFFCLECAVGNRRKGPETEQN